MRANELQLHATLERMSETSMFSKSRQTQFYLYDNKKQAKLHKGIRSLDSSYLLADKKHYDEEGAPRDLVSPGNIPTLDLVSGDADVCFVTIYEVYIYLWKAILISLSHSPK